MAWIEGFTTSTEVLKTIARNACTLFKDADGNLIPGKNWEIVYPSPLKHRTVRRVTQEVLASRDYQLYNTANRPLVEERGIRVFRNGAPVNASEYSVDYHKGTVLFKTVQREIVAVTGEVLTSTDRTVYRLANDEVIASSLVVYRNDAEVDPTEYIFDSKNGVITFRFQQKETDQIKADYRYLGEPFVITADYTCYADARSVVGEALATSDGIRFTMQNGNLMRDREVRVYRNGTYVMPDEYTVDYANGVITFGSVQTNVVAVAGEQLATTDYLTYTFSRKPVTFEDSVVVYRDGSVVSTSEYDLDRINGKVTFKTVQRRIVKVVQEVATTTDNKVYTVAYKPVVPGSVVVYRNTTVIDGSEYIVNYQTGTITFNAQQNASATITVDYSYYGLPYNITADYAYYDSVVSLSDVVLTTSNYVVYSTGQKNVLPQNLAVKRNGVVVDPSEYTLDSAQGLIIFTTMQDQTAVITASFMFCPRIDYITADYSYYATLLDVVNEQLVPVNNQVFYTYHKPVSAEHTLIVYKNSQPVSAQEYVIDYQSGMIVFAAPVNASDQITIDYGYYTDGIEEAIAAIKDRLVLKTTTTPVELTEEQKLQNRYIDERLNMTSLTMYVEFQKPDRLVNPETANEYYKDPQTGLYVRAGFNHHYLNVRMFDKWDVSLEQPVPSIFDSSGKLVVAGAAVSPWSKLSWFRDWEEIPVAYADRDLTNDAQVGRGSCWRPVGLPPVIAEIPIRYWMSVNNDRLIMVLMGEPSIDYKNYLMGFAYLGRIKPYEDGINDTFGNFALTTTSSTVPCKMGRPPAGRPTITSIAGLDTGTMPRGYYCYVVTYTTADGESAPSDYKQTFAGSGTASNAAVKITVDLPEEATGWRVYRYYVGTGWSSTVNPADLSRYQLVAIISDPATREYIDSSTTAVPESPPPYGRCVTGVVRDPKTGAIIKVNYPDNYGTGTANGVTDISMYRTRGGAFYQQHRPAFHTPEEFMTKVGFNPSTFTGKVYVSCISVVHPFDGYRGTLDGVVAVDGTSLAPLDELIVTKGKPAEETYKCFAINAPYSFISASANSFYGIAIKKA